MSWQTAVKTSSRELDKDTVPYDLYFANGKPLRIDEDGTLSMTMEPDDTSIIIDHPLKVRLTLDVRGVTGIKNLLAARGAKIYGTGKQSAPRQSANVSIKSPANGDSSDVQAVAGHPEVRKAQQKKSSANNQSGENRVANGKGNKKLGQALPGAAIRPDMDQPNAFPQDARAKRPLPVPISKSKEASKSSKPEQDLRPSPDSKVIEEEASSVDVAIAPVKLNAKPGHDSRTSRVPQPLPISRDSTGSLSPVPPEFGQNAEKELDPVTNQHASPESQNQSKPETDSLTSTARKAKHTYAKPRGSKTTTTDKHKTQLHEKEIEDSESDSRNAGDKRSNETESGSLPGAKKSRKGEFLRYDNPSVLIRDLSQWAQLRVILNLPPNLVRRKPSRRQFLPLIRMRRSKLVECPPGTDLRDSRWKLVTSRVLAMMPRNLTARRFPRSIPKQSWTRTIQRNLSLSYVHASQFAQCVHTAG